MLDYKMESNVAVDMGIAFLQHSSGLRKLSMSFDIGGDAALFLRRLMHVDVFKPPTQLQELTLASAFVSGDDLAALLCRVGHSLRVVSFRSVRITRGSRAQWRAILEILQVRCPYLNTVDSHLLRNESCIIVHFFMIAGNPIVGAGVEAREFQFIKHCYRGGLRECIIADLGWMWLCRG